MKQVDTLQKSKRWRTAHSRYRLWCMMLLAVLMGTASGYGQITWTSVTLSPNVLPVAGKPAQLSFKALTGDIINDPTIEISLPDYIEYKSASGELFLNTVKQSGATFDTSTSGKIVITGLSSIASGVEVEALLLLKAGSGAELNPDDVTVNLQFYDDDQKFGSVHDKTSVVAKVPGITITPKELSIPYMDKTAKHTYTLAIGATDVEINNFELRLTVDDKTTLEDIELDGTPLTYTTSGSSSIVYTIPVSETQLGGVIAAGTKDNKITFKASSTLEALRTIKAEAAYPDFTNSCATAVEVELLMAYDLPGGKPVLNHYDLANESYYTATPTIGAAKIATDDIPMDLTTTSYARTLFKNTGDAAAYEVELDAYPYGSFSIVDVDNVWYSIDGGVPQKISGIKGETHGGRLGHPLKEPAKSPNAFTVRLPSGTFVPINGFLEVWVGTKNGQIYNISDDLNVYTTDVATISGYRINISYCESQAGKRGTSVAPSYVIAYQGWPHFKEAPNRKVYQPGDTYTQEIRFSTYNGSKTKGKFEVKLDIPSWLTLETDGVKWINTKGNTIKTATKISDTKYVFDFAYISESYLTFDFKAGSSSTDQQGSVRYTINHIPGDGTGSIDRMSQVIQSVSLWAENNGITLVSPASGVDPFRLIRKTRGYLDDDNNGIPNTPQTTAGENDDILHTSYINGDKGKMIWDGKILGGVIGNEYAAGGTLYLVGELKELDKSKFKWEAVSATVGGTPVTPTITWDDDTNGKKFVIKYTGNLPKDALFHVELHFEANGGSTNRMGSVETKCYIHTVSDKNPDIATADGCLGNAVASSPFGLYSLDTRVAGIGGDSYSVGFEDNSEKDFNAFVAILNYSRLQNPYFNKEARILALPGVFQMTLPEGYEMVGNTVTLTYVPSSDRSEEKIVSYPFTYDKNLNICTVDVSDVFDLNQDESTVLAANKFSFPDDKWTFKVGGKYKAQQSAQPVSTMNFTYTLTDKDKNAIGKPLSRDVTFNYSGTSIDVTTADANTTKPIPGKVGTSLISLSNTATSALTDVWLYIDGDVKNVKLLDSATGADVSGGGGISGSNWIKLPSGLPASPKSLSYVLSVEHDGSTSSDFPVRVQVVSDYNKGGYTPNVTSDVLADIPGENKGRATTITFSPQPATVSGELTSSTQTLTFNTPFILTTSINSERSSGHLYDGYMTLHIPAGYEFVGGAANTAAYNGGTPVALPIAIQTALSTMGDAGADITLKVSDVLTSNDVLVGLTGREGVDNKVEVKFNIQLKPVCNITLTDRITANIFGKDAYGAAAVKNNDEIKLPRMSATGVDFSFNVSVTPSQKAFGAADTDQKTIDVTLEKLTVNEVAAVTYVEVVLPKVLNLDGNTITMNSSDLGITDRQLTITTTENTVSGNTRTLKIDIPVTEYNASGADKGANKKVSYTIPVKYTYPIAGSAEHIALVDFPEQDVEATVITEIMFGTVADCGTGITTQPNPLVSKTEKIAFLMTDKDASFNVHVGETVNWTINSAKFDGTVTATDGTLSTTTLTLAPTAASYPDATAFDTENGKKTEKVTVAVSIDGNSYGTVELPYVVYPSMDFSLNTIAPYCSNDAAKNVTDLAATFIQTGHSKWIDVVFSENASFTPLITAKDFAIGTTTLKIRAQHNTESTIVGATAQDVVVTVNTAVAATLSADKTAALVGETITLTAGGASASGNGTYYQYYVGSTAIDGPTTATTKTYTPLVGDVGTLSFTVKIVNNANGDQDDLCGTTESAAVSVTVTDRPAGVTLNNPSGPIYDCGATATLDLKALFNNPGDFTTETFWWNTTGTSPETTPGAATAFTTTISLSTGTTHMVYVWAKNAFNYSSTAAQVNVTAIKYAPITLGAVTAADVEAAAGTNATATIAAAVSAGEAKANSKFDYKLYDNTDNEITAAAAEDGASHNFSQSVAVPALTTTSVTGYAEYIYKVTATGMCAESAKKEVKVKVYPTATIAVDGSLATTFCTTTAATAPKLSAYVSGGLKTDWFDYTYTGNGATDATLDANVSLPTRAGTYTYTLKAKNKKAGSTAVPTTLTITVYDLITFGPVTTPLEVEGSGNTTITAPTAASGTVVTYELLKNNVSVATGNTSGSFWEAYTAHTNTSTAYTSVTYKVKGHGAISCAEGMSDAIELRIYPTATIVVDGTVQKDFCTTDNALTTLNLADYVSGGLNTTWFDYTYTGNGATDATLNAGVALPTTAGTYTYTLSAKNKMTNATAVSTTVVIRVVTPIALSPITTPQNLEGTGSISLIANPTAGTPVSFEWYKDAVKQSETSGTLRFSYGHTDPNTAFTTNTYYAKALGAIACADAQTNNVVVNVYPTPTLSLATTSDAYCEDNAVLTAGIDLWSYINTPNDVWFTYTYSGNGVTDGALAAGTVTIPTKPGTYTYTIKAVNKLATSTLEATETITIKVDRQTKITKQPTSVVVTEWDAFTLSVEAVAEGAITYQWEKWNTYLQVFETVPGATSATYVVNRSVAKDAGLYRVVVTGGKGTACGKKVIPSDEVNVQVNPNGLCQITYASSEEGELVITDTDGNVIPSGTYVVPGTKVKAMATARTAGYDLWQLVANGTVIDNNSTIEIAGHTHFFAHFTLDGKNPNPGVGNVEVTDGSQIWTNKGYVHILTEKPCKARIITFTGRVLIDRAISEGETQIYMPEGLYIVTLSDGTREKVSVKY
ncbi:hypothetical protein M2101_001743 [Parabacteroides sp. PM5-20]|uniref:hypothetical protein n=2 Tax=Bacteroidales TaxID=171549 RepID=UPI0024756D18|nr:hypothetical protein [Parabacteroides sp. PM5-20]MDH6535065.1 hypothetical protein [Parabacteroides sp. PM5-20]